MCRELRRVPKDFNWPIGQIWYGYLSPYQHNECPVCKRSGLNPETKKLNDDWLRHGIGHDTISRWICVEATAKRMGIFGDCDFCDGAGELWHTPEIKKAAEEWEPLEPPTGEGFQLWEATTEGSPISPVFDSMDELCEWAEGNATTFGESTATASRWKQMLEEGMVFHQEGNMIFM